MTVEENDYEENGKTSIETSSDVETDIIESVSTYDDKAGDEESSGQKALLNLQALDLDELTALVDTRSKKIGEQEFLRRTRETGTYENVLISLVETYSHEAARVLDFVGRAALNEDSNFSYKLLGDNGKTRIGDSVIYSPKKIYKEPLSGVEAQLAYMARKKGPVRRVMALSSGITLTVRAPVIYEISTFIRNITSEEVSYGRDAGVQYFSFADYIVKRCCIDFIKELIVDCSLKDWDTDNKQPLLKAIKLTDFGHIAMKIQELMYPDGYPNFQLACPNPDCAEVTEPVTMSISEFIHHRFTSMPEKCIKFSETNRASSGTVTFKDLNEYQKNLGFDNKTFDIDDYRYTFTVPSLWDYLEIGAVVVADIEADIHGSRDSDAFEAISSRALLTYLPWISKIEILLYDEDPDVEPVVQMEFSDINTLASILMDLIGNVEHEQQLTSTISDLIDESQITLICYAPKPCESCGYEIPTKSGMVSLDPVSSFFIQASWYVHQHFIRREAALISAKSTKR